MNPHQSIFTEAAQCQDCYKCLRQCAVKAIKIEKGHAMVIPELCVVCGHCVEICPVGAKKVRQGLDRAKLLLRMQKKYSSPLHQVMCLSFPIFRRKI